MPRFSFLNRPPVLFFTFIVVAWLLAAEAKAQTQEAPAANSAMAKGAWAMQFSINDNFTLSSFQGTTLSLKRHYSTNRALRFGLNLGGSFSNDKQSSETETKSETDGNSQNLGFGVRYMLYPAPDKRAKLFFGFGPSVGFSRSKQTQRYTNLQHQLRTESTSTNWSAGLGGMLGIEWFATSHISLLAEYASFLGYFSAHTELANKQDDGSGGFIVSNKSLRNVDSFSLGANAVNFGLSVYF